MIPIILIGAAYLIGKSMEGENFSTGGKVNLLAPNGKPSKLTPEQWHLVRTPEFKAWFGDWENDAKNASKVVDENEEPLVVFHGTDIKFNEFKIGEFGFHFGSKEAAKERSNIIKPFFLNVKKRLLVDYDLGDWSDIDMWKEYLYAFEETPLYKIVNKAKDIESLKISILKKYDGIMYFNAYEGSHDDYSWMVFKPTQIKLADGTNATLDGSNPDIRYDEGGETDNKEFWGNVGAGILPICKKTGRILLNLRSSHVFEPNTYGVYGGKLDDEVEDEAGVISAAKREFKEETGYDGKIDIVPSYVYRYKDVFTYYNFIGIIDDEFEPELDWESDGHEWLTLKEFLEIEPKHFGLQELIKNDIKTIKKYAKKQIKNDTTTTYRSCLLNRQDNGEGNLC